MSFVTYHANLLRCNFGRLSIALTACLSFCTSEVVSQDAQLKKALAITPKQVVDYEKPEGEILKACKFVEKKTKPTGFVVHHESGRILRQFFDNNGDGQLDQWSYFNNGIEVYRDLDLNFDKKTDQYRWLGTAGTRWGMDPNQDGIIDSWKVISPEEVAFECFQAIKNVDQERFNRLLLTPDEYQSLGLGPRISQDVKARWEDARANFLTMAQQQKVINSKAKWIYAGNGQAAMSVAGAFGNKADLIVYDLGSGFFDSNGIQQLGIGSMVKVGDVWRLIELPEVVDPSKPLVNGGAFFPTPEWGISGTSQKDNEMLAKLHDRLSEVEKRLASSKGAAIAKAEKDKADVLTQFYENTSDKIMKRDWLENLADSVSSAYQVDRFEGGLDYLDEFISSHKNETGMDYVKWRSMFAKYGWTMANGSGKQERDEGYDTLMEDLKAYQKAFPDSVNTADALIQLAVHYEVRSPDDAAQAIEWYRQCKSRFPTTKYGRRATGALTRLEGMGKPFKFNGNTLDGKFFDLRKAKGKIVVLHFWETWCADGFDELAKIQSKYDDVLVVGCNIEQNSEDFKSYLSKNKSKLTWMQLHAPGTVDDSPLAHQLGVATEPMVVLIDKKGNLIDTNIAFNELEREIVRERRR